jgi:hypothetical protein
MGANQSSWRPVCESMIEIAKINLKTEVRVLLILDDAEATYVLMTGGRAYQWFQVKPATLKVVNMPVCDTTKKISTNTSFIGELSKRISVPTEDAQNEILFSCK